MSFSQPFAIFDADNHMYETEEAFTKFLPEQFKGAIRYVQVDGRTKIAVRGQISEYIPNPTFEVVARPGAQEDYFRHGNPEGKSFREIVGKPMRSIPAFRDPAARLALMDEQGIDRSLMFPTLASLLEERMRDDPELTHVVIHALNEWMHETWSFNYENRIFSTPVITLPIVEKAIAELDWCVERGARAVLIRPAPVPTHGGSRSFALPEFDPFWKRVVETGVLVAMHSSDSGYSRYANDWEGSGREYLPFQPNVFRMIGQWRPIEDTVASLICHGTLSRFPELKIAVIENGASWVAPLLKNLRDLYKKHPHQFAEEPVTVLRRNIHVSPFWEEDMAVLSGLLGVERVLFGSDYPHPEGLADPASYVNALKDLSDEDKAKILGGNMDRLIPV
ncbi:MULTISPECIES: amidohydrolase family protein [unclassified Frankia]|uniref:amidohydrolase family protein n=1 Tax=unclassified Frankia TaxID=2632575 RepID=UPI00200E5206|nr:MULTISPECIES: amidohydrolase family protein [unclassified Frankia]MCK9897777.1 amidohydrolase [Frankia sp. AgB32]MCL9793501.1 amidohydrolase [Frankia sp. AgKG'84/4]